MEHRRDRIFLFIIRKLLVCTVVFLSYILVLIIWEITRKLFQYCKIFLLTLIFPCIIATKLLSRSTRNANTVKGRNALS